MNKVTIDLEKTSVAETLIIPLLAKVKETNSTFPIIVDKKAVEILEHIPIDTKRFEGGEISDLGIVVRTEIIDNEIKGLLNFNSKLVIVNLGVGLDTRINRIDKEQLTWFDLDLPEVIKLRNEFFSENERVKFIPKSVLDESWMNEIAEVSNENIVFIAEGLFMYFTELEVCKILTMISDKFAGAHMYLDVVHSYFIGKGISRKFLWGIRSKSDIERMCENVKVEKSWSTGDLHKERQSSIFRIMNILPLTRNRSQILHIRFK